MMDEMDRWLEQLPEQAPSPGLAGRVKASVHGRHRRRQIARWSFVVLSSLCGFWLFSPATSWWISSADLYASGVPWLAGSTGYLNLESVQILKNIWYGMFSMQSAVGSSQVISIWVGTLFLCLAVFLALDSKVFEVSLPSNSTLGNRSA